jgi:aminopeptidase-like protein
MGPIGSNPTLMESYFDRLWPILRSITGPGVRQTLSILAELLPLRTTEIPSGTQVFDWTIPQEWVLKDAYVADLLGNRIIDVQSNTLHILNYSIGFNGVVSFEELDQHLYSLPEQPEAIPYVTSYYKPRWGFCISHSARQALDRNAFYTVAIDAQHINGSLTLAEAVLPGDSDNEVLISTYICHPSMANNELSGPLVAAFLYNELATLPNRRFTYRFIFAPETIGAIAYLAMNGARLRATLVAGFVLTCLGDRGSFTYKRSRTGDSLADRAATTVLRSCFPEGHTIVDFFPMGSDERQYCSPGFNLPVGSLMRTMYGRFPEYHTSLDNKDFICFDALVESVRTLRAMVECLEANRAYLRTMPYCEIKLDKYGFYPDLNIKSCPGDKEATNWLLNYSDGRHDLIDISNLSGVEFQKLRAAAPRLVDAGIITSAC